MNSKLLWSFIIITYLKKNNAHTCIYFLKRYNYNGNMRLSINTHLYIGCGNITHTSHIHYFRASICLMRRRIFELKSSTFRKKQTPHTHHTHTNHSLVSFWLCVYMVTHTFIRLLTTNEIQFVVILQCGSRYQHTTVNIFL